MTYEINNPDHEANVVQALENAKTLPPGASDSEYPWFEYRVLAAEVKRLRAELPPEDWHCKDCCTDFKEHELDRLDSGYHCPRCGNGCDEGTLPQ